MAKSTKHLIIRRHLNAMDYGGLLAFGAPSDEFDLEIRELCALIHADGSVCAIAQAIAQVFTRNLGESLPLERCLDTAARIHLDLQKYS